MNSWDTDSNKSFILGQVWYLIVSIPDLCNLTYFSSESHLYSGCIVNIFCVVCILVIYYTNKIKFKPIPRNIVFINGKLTAAR